MRILYHHRTQAGDAQGVHIQAMVRAFSELGHEVEVLGAGNGGPAGRSTRTGALLRAFRRASPPWLYELMTLAYNVYGYRALRRRIRARRPDLIYERYSLNTFSGVWASRRFGIPLILEVNAPLYREQLELGALAFKALARFSERWICSHATHTLVVSNVMKDLLAAQGVPREKMAVTPNGVDPSQLRPPAAGDAVRRRYQLGDSLVLGFVGWFRKWHGLEMTLDVFQKARLGDRGVKLLLVGDGPVVAELRHFVRTYHLDRWVVFTGPLEHDEVSAHIAAFDIALQPRATEYACPMKLVEYMAMGKCIVAPDQPNIRELLEHGVTGRLFTPDHHESLEAALAHLIEWPGERRRLSEGARRAVLERGLLWSANARKALEVAGLRDVGCASSS